MQTTPLFVSGLMRRYDTPGPRYTSYPTAPRFSDRFGAAELLSYARSRHLDKSERPLSLYMHVPFCFSPCFYCGCNRIITRDFGRGAVYVERLVRELKLAAQLVGKREVVQLHIGGGTPNFLSPDALQKVIEAARQLFEVSQADDRDLSIEIDPRHVRSEDLTAYREIGFNRLSFGVQDFDAEVQRAVNREQSEAEILDLIGYGQSLGFRSINVDLIYGLPRQTLASFERTLASIVEARPNRLAIYAYAHMPHLFKAQRHINANELPESDAKLELLRLAIRALTQSGYRYIGMDHFALESDELARAQDLGNLHRNFMGYTTHADCDLLGVGVSAISHLGETFTQNPRDINQWESRIDAGELPAARGLELSHDDVIRAAAIQQLMCQGSIDTHDIEDQFDIDFTHYFDDALAELKSLERDGLVVVTRREVAATAAGRLLLRRIAQCFDRYADRAEPALSPAVVPARQTHQ